MELFDKLSTRAGFSLWLTGDTGKILAHYERQKVNRILTGLFGYHITQIGHYPGAALHSTSRIRNKVVLHLEEDGAGDADCGVLAASASLPFAEGSIDVLILPHVLEFICDPDATLREVERVLIAGGHLVIIGFNPWSLYGLWRLFPRVRRRSPWNGRFHDLTRIRNWLSMLDFELLETDRFLFRPPLIWNTMQRRLLFLEKMGRFCWPVFASAYIILAKKQRAPMSPIKMNWRDERKIIPSGTSADPATRVDTTVVRVPARDCLQTSSLSRTEQGCI